MNSSKPPERRALLLKVGGASFCAAFCHAALLPTAVSLCIALAALSAGPGLAVVLGGITAAYLFLVSVNFVLPAWCLALAVGLACVGIWLTPSLRVWLHFVPSRSRFRGAIALGYPIFGVLLGTAAALVRVPDPLSWLIWGMAFLGLGLAQPCPVRERRAAARRVLSHFTAGVAVAILSIILAEAALRVAGFALHGRGLFAMTAESSVVVPHSRRFYTNAPNTSGVNTFKIAEGKVGQVPFHISRHGLRGPDYGPKAADELRILVLGDSFAFGLGLEDAETIEAVLERKLEGSCPGKRVRVINAGTSGYSVWQELDLLNELGFSLQPDLVVHLINPSNDLDGFWERRKTFPKTHSVEWRRALQPYMYRDNWRFWVQDALFQHSRILATLKRAFPSSFNEPVLDLTGWFRFIPRYRLPRVPQHEDRPFGLELNKTTWEPGVPEAFEEMCRDIMRTRDDCRARNVAYAAAVLPAPACMDDARWKKTVRDYPEGAYVQGAEITVTEGALAGVGIPIVPLYGPLREAGRAAETHYPLDGHLNKRGAEVVAEAMRRFVVSQFLPDRCKMARQAAQ